VLPNPCPDTHRGAGMMTHVLARCSKFRASNAADASPRRMITTPKGFGHGPSFLTALVNYGWVDEATVKEL